MTKLTLTESSQIESWQLTAFYTLGPFWVQFHKALQLHKLQIYSYSQILTVNDNTCEQSYKQFTIVIYDSIVVL